MIIESMKEIYILLVEVTLNLEPKVSGRIQIRILRSRTTNDYVTLVI